MKRLLLPVIYRQARVVADIPGSKQWRDGQLYRGWVEAGRDRGFPAGRGEKLRVRLEWTKRTGRIPKPGDVPVTSSKREWETLLVRYGPPDTPPEFRTGFEVLSGAEFFAFPLPYFETCGRLLRLLIAARDGDLEHLQRLFETRMVPWWEPFIGRSALRSLSWEPTTEFAESIVQAAVEGAVRMLDPRAAQEGTVFVARGWWPVLVLDTFVHRSAWRLAQRCRADGCDRIVPPGRRSFCSERCRQREKKRRQRSRMPRRSPVPMGRPGRPMGRPGGPTSTL